MTWPAFLILTLSSAIVSSPAFAAEIEGKLRPVVIDDEKNHETFFSIVRADKKPILRLKNVPPPIREALEQLPAGSLVRLSGTESNSGFTPSQLLSSRPTSARSLRISADIPVQLEAGTRKVAIVPLTFAGMTTTPACNAQTVLNSLLPNGSVAKYTIENLQGKVVYEPTLMQPIEVPPGECINSTDVWMAEIQRVLSETRSIDPNSFHNFVLLPPAGTSCLGSNADIGQGKLAERQLVVEMHPTQCAHAGTLGHELGHNLGWSHAQSATSEYGDFSDPMGPSVLVHSNSVRKILSGLIQPKHIQTITGPGAYRVYSQVKESPEIRVLRWPLESMARIRNFNFYDLQIAYRTPEGMDANWYNQANLNKTYGYLWSAMPGQTSLLGPVGDGQEFTVTANPMTVTQISHTADSALVCIKINGVGDCSVEIPAPRRISAVSIDRGIDAENYAKRIIIRASLTLDSTPYVGSVGFKIDGNPAVFDNASPFAICGQTANPNPCSGLGTGVHTVTATAYAGPNGTGTAGEPVQQVFLVAGDPLPVTLVSFSGKASGPSIVLTWKTTDEVNFDRFEIEESPDAKAWRTVGTVKAKGTNGKSGATQAYSFTRTASAAKTNFYYRLKMIDTDPKSFSYSKIVVVKSDQAGKEPIVIPSPIPSSTMPKTPIRLPGLKERLLQKKRNLIE